MRLLIDRVREVVARDPEAVAIVCAGEPVLRYGELWARALGVAARLRDAELGRGDVVALHLEKSPDFVVGMIGVWAAGAAWVPVLPELPEARKQWIVDETGARVALVASDRVPGWLAIRRTIVDVRTVAPSSREKRADRRPDDLAYVIYTSGSTGEPKGVCVPQRGLVPLLDAQVAAFDLRAGDRCLWMLSPGFDASISDVGTALLAGANLHIEHPARLNSATGILEVMRQRRITHCDLPPSLLPLPDPGAAPPDLRTLVIGGEVAALPAVRAWASRVRVVNVYGPTETTVCSSLCVCEPDWERPLIGCPVPGTQFRIVDGELWIGGEGVAIGYLDRPALNAAKFVEHDGARWFRTGDRVREIGGELEFLGRLDRQLKLRGVLIAPEEIEARLCEHASVAEALVVAERRGSHDQLVAYVAPRGDLDAVALRDFMAARLDARTIPHRIVQIAAIPRTPSGKPDTAALLAASFAASSIDGTPAGLVAASIDGSPTEHALAAIWARLLGSTPRRDDDFFALGGDSLAVIEHVGLAELAGLAMTAEQLYTHRTLGVVAAAIDDALVDRPVRSHPLIEDAAPLQHRRRTPVRTGIAGGSLVLTGATGFLGARVLSGLVERSDAPIECLVRDGGRERLEHALGRIGRGDLIPRLDRRVTCATADLARPRCGLDDTAWHALAERASAIVHCGAEVSLAKPYAALRGANVAGTANVLALAATGRPKCMHHASTLSVFAGSDRAPGTLRETDALETAERLHGGYAQSKWAAEWLAREASATIYRFGLLTGDTETGRAPPRDWLTWFLRGLARLGAYPRLDAELRVDITPIDHASRALVELVLADAEGVFHVANERSATLADLIAAIERTGVAMRAIEPAAWSSLLATHAAANDIVEIAATLLGTCRGHARYDRARACDVFQATAMTFDTTRVIAAVGQCPPPSPELLDRYVARALEGL